MFQDVLLDAALLFLPHLNHQLGRESGREEVQDQVPGTESSELQCVSGSRSHCPPTLHRH